VATDIATLAPGLGPAGDITSVTLAGTSDRPRIKVSVDSLSNPAFSASGIAFPDAASGAWSVTLTAGDDFGVGDVVCDDRLEINIEWLNAQNAWVQEDRYPIDTELACDTCSISITEMVGFPASGGGMQEVIVRGTALTCDAVEVTVFDENGNECTASADVVGSAWEAHLVQGAAGVGTNLKSFDCNEDHRITARCRSARRCTDEATLPVTCAQGCRPFVDVHVTPPDGGEGFDNPQTGELPCVPGDYTIEVTNPPASTDNVYEWYRNQNQTPLGGESASSLTVTITAGENVTYTVRVTTPDDCQSTFAVTFACGAPPDTGKPPPDEGGGGDGGGGDGGGGDGAGGDGGGLACAVLLWIAFACMFVGTVLLVVGCVLEHFEPTSATVLMIIGAVLFALGWILLAIWLLVCAALTDCPAILAVRDVVIWLIWIFAAVALILALLALGDSFLWPCAGLALAAGLNWGLVLAILDWVGEQRGCININRRRRRTARQAARRVAAPRTGVGTAAKRVTMAMGIAPCAGCQKRADMLDRLTPRLKRAT
jgi:hypothetical protein